MQSAGGTLQAFRPGTAQVWEDGPLRIWEHWLLGNSVIVTTSEACSLLQFTGKITLPLKMAWHHHSPRSGIRATSVSILSILGPWHTSWVTQHTISSVLAWVGSGSFARLLPLWMWQPVYQSPFLESKLDYGKILWMQIFQMYKVNTLLGTFPRSWKV